MKKTYKKLTSPTSVQLDLLIGSIILTLILLGELAIGIYLNFDNMWWGSSGAICTVGFTCFTFRFFNWCDSKHFILPSILILGIYFFLISNGYYLPEWQEKWSTYFALILVFFMIIAPGFIAMYIANLVNQHVHSTIIRTVLLLVIGTLLASIFLPKFISDQYILKVSKKHSMIMGEPDLNVKAKDLNNTEVFATIDNAITKGTNLIWCATMQMAWDKLCNFIGEDILFDSSNFVAEALNKRHVTPNDLDDNTYVAIAGADGINTRREIDEALQAKFDGAASPEILPEPLNDLIAYSYLFVNLPFEWTFERHKTPFVFQGKKVKSFGINEGQLGHLTEIKTIRQILVYDAQGEDDFIVELKTRKTKHHLILAKVPAESTLERTIASVQQRILSTKPGKLGANKSLIVPMLNFKILRDFHELTGKPLVVQNKQYNGRQLILVQQLIRFKLNERGAILKSEAVDAFCFDEKPNLIFDKPFLIMLQYEGAKNPYFAVWVDNAEILVGF